VSDHVLRREAFLRDVSGWLKEGKLKYKEDVVQGLENAPRAFLGLFQGKNFGKLIVQVSPDPTKAGAAQGEEAVPQGAFGLVGRDARGGGLTDVSVP